MDKKEFIIEYLMRIVYKIQSFLIIIKLKIRKIEYSNKLKNNYYRTIDNKYCIYVKDIGQTSNLHIPHLICDYYYINTDTIYKDVIFYWGNYYKEITKEEFYTPNLLR